jgi:hypothetical protein
MDYARSIQQLGSLKKRWSFLDIIVRAPLLQSLFTYTYVYSPVYVHYNSVSSPDHAVLQCLGIKCEKAGYLNHEFYGYLGFKTVLVYAYKLNYVYLHALLDMDYHSFKKAFVNVLS